MSEQVGSWRIDWAAFAEEQDNVRTLDELVSSDAPPPLGGGRVDDFSAVMPGSGEEPSFFVRMLPFSEASDVIRDADLLIYVWPRLKQGGPVELFKQRGWHAEICYRNEGETHQTAAWGNEGVRDATFIGAKRPNRIMHAVRLELPSVEPQRLRQLKAEVRRWRRVFDRYRFPKGGDLYTGSHKYFDPSDFGSTEDLAEIARKLVARRPGSVPAVPDVTCVQWCHQVLSLALCFPLSERTLSDLGVKEEYADFWEAELGCAPGGLEGLDELPYKALSPAQVAQDVLDVYCGGRRLLDLIKQPDSPLYGVLIAGMLSGMPEAVRPDIEAYIEGIQRSGDLSSPLRLAGKGELRFLLPISFFCSARRASRPGAESSMDYIGTFVNDSVLVREGTDSS